MARVRKSRVIGIEDIFDFEGGIETVDGKSVIIPVSQELIGFYEDKETVRLIKKLAKKVGGITEFYRLLNIYLLKAGRVLTADNVRRLKAIADYYGEEEFAVKIAGAINRLWQELPASKTEGEIHDMFDELEEQGAMMATNRRYNL